MGSKSLYVKKSLQFSFWEHMKLKRLHTQINKGCLKVLKIVSDETKT